jgi:phenylpropionate dioxygenase-like ring-hydroxylating dioxygenase large terminal subunit
VSEQPGTVPPHAFPTGWHRVADASDIQADTVAKISYLERELVAFRDGMGAVRVFNAYCPHLGAHLGVGGTVSDGELVCPFHAWRFDGTGRCTSIPYAEKVPTQAKLQPYPVREVDGMVLVYFDETRSEQPWSSQEAGIGI